MFHQLVDLDLGIVDQRIKPASDLSQVVRGDLCRHTDSDAHRAIAEQVRKLGRQDLRLLPGLVVVIDVFNRVLFEIGQRLHRRPGQPRFGITHGRRRITVNRTKVALA